MCIYLFSIVFWNCVTIETRNVLGVKFNVVYLHSLDDTAVFVIAVYLWVLNHSRYSDKNV